MTEPAMQGTHPATTEVGGHTVAVIWDDGMIAYHYSRDVAVVLDGMEYQIRFEFDPLHWYRGTWKLDGVVVSEPEWVPDSGFYQELDEYLRDREEESRQNTQISR